MTFSYQGKRRGGQRSPHAEEGERACNKSASQRPPVVVCRLVSNTRLSFFAMEGERSLRAEAQRTLLEYQEGINEFLQAIAGATERAGGSVSSESLLCKEIEGIVAIDKKWQRIILERLCLC